MKLFPELRWTHHFITPSLQGWSLCFFRSCFRQFTSKWKCRFEGWSKSQKFLANCWVEIQQSQWSVRVIWCFKKPRRGLCGILPRADWIKLKSNKSSNRYGFTQINTSCPINRVTAMKGFCWCAWRSLFSSLSSASWTSLGFLYSHTTRTEM